VFRLKAEKLAADQVSAQDKEQVYADPPVTLKGEQEGLRLAVMAEDDRNDSRTTEQGLNHPAGVRRLALAGEWLTAT